MFAHCHELQKVILVDCPRVTRAAFVGCINICEITIQNCHKIEPYAFSWCTSLKKLTFAQVGKEELTVIPYIIMLVDPEEVYLPNCIQGDILQRIQMICDYDEPKIRFYEEHTR